MWPTGPGFIGRRVPRTWGACREGRGPCPNWKACSNSAGRSEPGTLPGGASQSPETMGEIGNSHDRIVKAGLRHRESLKPLPSPGRCGRRKWRKGHNSLPRLRDHRDAVLLFTCNPPVPDTNNIAELDLCMEEGRSAAPSSGRFRRRHAGMAGTCRTRLAGRSRNLGVT